MKINIKRLLVVWSVIIILLVAFYPISLYLHVYDRLLLVLTLLNILSFGSVYLYRKAIESRIFSLIEVAEKFYNESEFEILSKKPNKIELVLITSVLIFGFYIVAISFTNVNLYTFLIREDGIIENISAILWGLAFIISSIHLTKKIRKKTHVWYYYIPDMILIAFFFICLGEEISWGQRIFEIRTPELLKTVNVQNEITLHNIGSISVFSNIFFLLTILFYLVFPFLISKYYNLRIIAHFFDLPIPTINASYIFIICLIIWLMVGIRFGTLGFHPFSFYIENYYTQMDDEIFELLAAYSFFSFSVIKTRR